MKPHRAKKELALLPILFIAIALCVGGHFVLQPNYQDSHIVEYALAALPFALFALVIIAIRMAIKQEQDEQDEE
ncbi:MULTISPECIES: hypothetical protein [Pseudoalteromonas]|uniref:DUF3098 domain-containing protein n=1 Tax=Pseudoalteromonas ruthenica TaxID=151081 RepID=A0A0F4Q3R9_9GAMM|nr:MULTISPECIES: hypothetical protein [Pseudoalteromonas]MCG7543447.1 hypothetical protein [Pseudoalteromonas sp. MM17-2]MCG7567145.1 hypothetical protein [Pseudoalteromonas sp. CnMc7-15]MCG7570731.1 hypothetical protein [Pseudoalteromonas sp. CNC9-20]KJY97929.1 hypothetical protein TW76_08980 [Pseudoalteromonas ruthenica]KJZ01954.1 hypothetical protein TW72_03195 [Pseudoalteromonas ruthenica]